MTNARLSAGEETLAFHLRALGVDFEREYRFSHSRRWKADFYLPLHRALIEVEGGTYTGGRHTRGSGYALDCEKYNHAVAMGYRLFRFTSEQVRKGEAIAFIEKWVVQQI